MLLLLRHAFFLKHCIPKLVNTDNDAQTEFN